MVTDGEAAASMRGLETIYLLRDRNWTSSINSLCVDVDLFNDIYVLVFGTGSVNFFIFLIQIQLLYVWYTKKCVSNDWVTKIPSLMLYICVMRCDAM